MKKQWRKQEIINSYLFISDMDGTLLGPDGKISETSVKLLRELIRQGLHFTVATARTPVSALALLKEIPISDPMILMNGALIYDPQSRNFLQAVELGQDAMERIACAEKNTGAQGIFFSVRNGILYIHSGDVDNSIWNESFDLTQVAHEKAICPDIHQDNAETLQGSAVVYGLYADNKPEQLELLYQELKSCSGLTLDYYKDRYSENRWCLEIFSSAASKGKALRTIKEQLNKEQLFENQTSQAEPETFLIGFGDSWNDLPLFEVCDEAYAVANASEDLKVLAKSVIPGNAEDGVAQFIREWWENHEKNPSGQPLYAEYSR